ncbi:hypothetical protein BJX64DRAFT_284385 [Aspergillus heterothallicus]
MANLTALDLSQRPPRVSWTDDMRKVLCCLVKYYERDWNAFLAIFNRLFRQELLDHGFTDGRLVGWGRLNTQWETLKKQGDPIWGDVHCSSFAREPWLPILDIIEKTAASLEVIIVHKEHDTIDSSQFVYRARARESSSEIGQRSQETTPRKAQQSSLANTVQHEIEEHPQLGSWELLCTAGGKKCLWCHQEGLDQEEPEAADRFQAQIPQLLYRWWNVDSQGVNSRDMFIAGLFTAAAIFAPDTIHEEEFKLRVMNHIARKSIPSPFISTFQSALSPVHRGLWNQEGATVSIIDSTRLKQSPVISAQQFCRKYSVKIGRTYDGRGEYLVWGTIPKDAIVCSFKITRLREIAAEDLDVERFLQLDLVGAYRRARRPLHLAMAQGAMHLDKRVGAAVGRLLSFLSVPSDYCKTISEGLAYSWRIKSKSIPWRDFFDGVDIGYRGECLLPSPSPSPVVGVEGTQVSLESEDDTDDDSDDGAEGVDSPDASDDEDDILNGTTPVIQRMFPIIDLDANEPTPFRNKLNSMNEHEVGGEDHLSVQLSIDTTDVELFEEESVQQENSSDQFADDRARVRSALGY